jgi:hypothetical protein
MGYDQVNATTLDGAVEELTKECVGKPHLRKNIEDPFEGGPWKGRPQKLHRLWHGQLDKDGALQLVASDIREFLDTGTFAVKQFLAIEQPWGPASPSLRRMDLLGKGYRLA